MEDCTLGNSQEDRANSRFGWTANCSLIQQPKCSMRRLQALAWPICQKAWCNRTSAKAASSGCLRIGALDPLAITSITQVGDSHPPLLRFWWMRCGTATELPQFTSAYGVSAV